MNGLGFWNNLYYWWARKRQEFRARQCLVRGGHEWFVDDSDFWLQVTVCRHCDTLKPNSVEMNRFVRHVQSLPEDQRQDAIEERKWHFRRRLG